MGGCGIQIAPGSELEALCRITSDETEQTKQREQGRAYAEGCTWAHRAQQWVRTVVNGPYFKTVIINLKRRRDRRTKMETHMKTQKIMDYEFMDAVDGNELTLTEHMRDCFKGNDFQYRKGVIGCAMSHMALWNQLIRDPDCELYAIIEDDAELVDSFEVKLNRAVRLFMGEPSAELCYISTNCLNSIKISCKNLASMQVIKKNNNEVDGTGGYLIKKSGAARFIDYYTMHSMTRAIDASIIDNFNDQLYELNEYLIKSIDSADTDVKGSVRSATTVAFCDWWTDEYGGGKFDVNDNFFVNLIKTHCGGITPVGPSQTPDVLFYSVFGQSAPHYSAGRKVFFAGEPVPHRADADFNITFDASNAANTRVPLWVCYFDEALLTTRQISKREKFCSYIATNPGVNRQTFVEQLSSQYKRVDCGGKHLNNIGGAIPPGTNASGKIEHGKQYKFAIAFENKQYPGYVTEKICDAYKSGCIPIYWGTPDIIKDFNPSTFINANDFSDFDALIDHIRRVDCDDALYASYFKEPVLSDAWMQTFTDPNHAFFKQLVSDILNLKL
jgi:GR25 family glycosyltransferase involved in LPS biosynthesis